MTLSYLFINAIYPQGFYEILRLLSAGLLSVVPPYNQLNDEYQYQLFFFPIHPELVNTPEQSFYRVGLTGYLILDIWKYIL